MPLFLDSFWDGEGFEVLNKHVDKENEFVNNIAQFVHQKASLDADYAKGLAKLSKSFASSGKEELGTMKDLWETFKAELDAQAKLFSQLATEVDEQIAKQLAHLRDEQSKQRKNVEKKVSAAEKSLSGARQAQKKAEKAILSQEKTLEQCYEAHEKSGGDPKTEKNLKKAQKDAEPLAADYRSCTKKAHLEKVRWEDAMISMSLEFEQMEKDRFKTTKELISKFADLHSQLFPQLQESHARIHQQCEQVSDEGDIQLFVNAKQTGPNRPEELLYRTYASDNKNPMASERRKAALTLNISEIDQDIESEKKGIAGLENLVKVYGEQPSYTNEAGMITTQRQLAHLQEYLSIIQNNQQSYVDLLGGLGGSRPSYSSGTPTNYSPVNSVAGPPAARPAPPSSIVKGVALYDFDPTNEGEIGLQEGDSIVVLDQSDPDWTKIQVRGNEGYVPRNYIEIN